MADVSTTFKSASCCSAAPANAYRSRSNTQNLNTHRATCMSTATCHQVLPDSSSLPALQRGYRCAPHAAVTPPRLRLRPSSVIQLTLEKRRMSAAGS